MGVSVKKDYLGKCGLYLTNATLDLEIDYISKYGFISHNCDIISTFTITLFLTLHIILKHNYFIIFYSEVETSFHTVNVSAYIFTRYTK